MPQKSLPERLKAARERLGLSQSQAAEQWQINLRTLQGWESGAHEPRGFAATQLNKLLNEILSS